MSVLTAKARAAARFPVAHYRALLTHLRERHCGLRLGNSPGHAGDSVSRALASGHPRARPAAGQTRGRACSIPTTPPTRVRAAPPRRSPSPAPRLTCYAFRKRNKTHRANASGGVGVFRLPMKRLRGSKFAYLWQYTRFLLSAFWFLARNSLVKKYDVVHVHNMPDFLVFAALVPRLRGARILLDLHDPMPELMMSIYGLAADRGAVRLLRMLERCSIRFAHLVLTPNITFKDLFVSRGCPPDKMQIVMNSPQIEVFDPARVPKHPPARDACHVFA